MIDSCTSRGVERKTAIYAPEMPRTSLLLLNRIRASSSAGSTASSTDTTASSSVYSMPCIKKAAYLGKKEKLKKLAGLMFLKRLLHHIGTASFLFLR